jgi:hypothetical protein
MGFDGVVSKPQVLYAGVVEHAYHQLDVVIRPEEQRH